MAKKVKEPDSKEAAMAVYAAMSKANADMVKKSKGKQKQGKAKNSK